MLACLQHLHMSSSLGTASADSPGLTQPKKNILHVIYKGIRFEYKHLKRYIDFETDP